MNEEMKQRNRETKDREWTFKMILKRVEGRRGIVVRREERGERREERGERREVS